MDVALDEAQLREAIGADVPDNGDIDELGYQLAYEASEGSGLGLSNLWEQAKIEFRALICTDDPRYRDVRERAANVSSSQTTTVVAFLSAGLGAVIGVSAAVLAPIVALLLLALARIGKESFCNVPRVAPR